jgi:hypothetical protein
MNKTAHNAFGYHRCPDYSVAVGDEYFALKASLPRHLGEIRESRDEPNTTIDIIDAVI